MRFKFLTSLSFLFIASACASVDSASSDQVGSEQAVASTSQALDRDDKADADDHGEKDEQGKSHFGFRSVENSGASVDAATAEADPRTLISVGKGLKVKVVVSSTALAPNTDQIALWPDDLHPTHLIVINEQGTTAPGVQRIRLSDGFVETILTGTTSGDPIRRTPWGTILAGEEAGTSGQMLEIINPLATTGVTYDRVAGTASGGVGAENVAARRALGRLSFEGLAILPNGVTYYGDEQRPGNGVIGGAYYKFVPATPRTSTGPIASLSESPLAGGQVYGLKLSRGTNNGQGNNTGLGVWVAVPNSNNANLRAAAPGLGLAGFYRPEDMDIDGEAFAAGNVRMCGNNTGNETDHNFGETICINDGSLADSATNVANPEVQFFVMGNPALAMPDNIAFNAKRKIWALNEDADGVDVGMNNDIWACSQDGSDFDLLSDECIRFASLNDLNAESTGGIFHGDGKHYFVSIQHNVTGHGVVLEISGF